MLRTGSGLELPLPGQVGLRVYSLSHVAVLFCASLGAVLGHQTRLRTLRYLGLEEA